MSAEQNTKSYYARVFGRSLFSIIFGKFFEVKNNTAAIVAIILVTTLCVVVLNKIEMINSFNGIVESLLNIIFVIVGYYFGAKQNPLSNQPENDEQN